MKKFVALILFILFAAFIYRTSVFRISKNFAVVDEGKVYRSAQLNEEELIEIVKKYQIKTVLSLRGSPGPTMFYQAESETLKKLGVNFQFIGMSDEFYPHQDEIKTLVHLFRSDAYPILVHCRVGADRTGLAAALYKKLIKNESIEQASEQLSFRFWHVRALHPAMNDFFKNVKDINWAMNEYNVCAPEYVAYRRPEYDCP